MFNKIKSMATGVANKVKGFVAAKETEMMAKAHAVLDGTVAEAYVDTGVKILIAVVIGALLLTLLYTLSTQQLCPQSQARFRHSLTTQVKE